MSNKLAGWMLLQFAPLASRARHVLSRKSIKCFYAIFHLKTCLCASLEIVYEALELFLGWCVLKAIDGLWGQVHVSRCLLCAASLQNHNEKEDGHYEILLLKTSPLAKIPKLKANRQWHEPYSARAMQNQPLQYRRRQHCGTFHIMGFTTPRNQPNWELALIIQQSSMISH